VTTTSRVTPKRSGTGCRGNDGRAPRGLLGHVTEDETTCLRRVSVTLARTTFPTTITSPCCRRVARLDLRRAWRLRSPCNSTKTASAACMDNAMTSGGTRLTPGGYPSMLAFDHAAAEPVPRDRGKRTRRVLGERVAVRPSLPDRGPHECSDDLEVPLAISPAQPEIGATEVDVR